MIKADRSKRSAERKEPLYADTQSREDDQLISLFAAFIA